MPPEPTNPNEQGPARSPGASRGAVIFVFVAMAALVALVWGVKPDRPNLKPAPLRAPDAACPKLVVEFTPTNFTELPGMGLDSLSKESRNRVLLRVNMEPCPCGCNMSIAYCLLNHPRCEECMKVAQRIIAESAPATLPRRSGEGAPSRLDLAITTAKTLGFPLLRKNV